MNVLRVLLNAYSDIDAGNPLPDRYFHTDIDDHVTTITEVASPD